MVEKFPKSSSRKFSSNTWRSFTLTSDVFHSRISSSIFLKSTNPLWTEFNIILQDFVKCNANQHRYFTAQTHENIRIESKASDILLQSTKWGSLVTVVTCMSPTSSVTCIPKKKYETKTDETPPGSIHACHPSGWVQSEIFTHFFTSSNIPNWQKKILLS